MEPAELARINKLYLAYFRAVGDILRDEHLRVEAKYRWFMKNVVEIVNTLRGFNYALFKFREAH